MFLWYSSSNTSIGRPKFGKEYWHVISIASFSSYQLAFNVINYFSRNLDNLLVGKYMGMVPLGLYEKSYQLMRYPLLITSFALTPAIQPILMKRRADVDYVVKEHNFLAKRLIALSSIIAVFIYTNSDSIVLLLFGEQWHAV
ncbi:TPA: oligosaccharide flippase family protein, partial [Vibrio campbellii]